LRLPRFSDIRNLTVVSPIRRPPLPLREDPLYSFLVEVSLTPQSQFGRKDQVNEKSRRAHRKSKPRHYSSAVP
jgi:hypothetical protein